MLFSPHPSFSVDELSLSSMADGVISATSPSTYSVFSSVYDVSLIPQITMPASGSDTSIRIQLASSSLRNGVEEASMPNEPAAPAD